MPTQPHKNLTEEIEDILTREIMHGVYPPGGMFPSEFDSVKRFGISRVTVRRVYANLEKKGILLRKIRCNTTVNDRMTAATDPIRMVGVLLPLSHEFSRTFLNSMNQEAARENALLVLAPPFNNGREQSRVAIDMVCGGVRNLVVWGYDHDLDLEVFRRLRLLGINLVFFDHVAPGNIADYVALDNEHAISALLDKAVQDGCHRFVFVNTAGLEVETNMERERLFRKFCQAENLPCEVTALPWYEMLKNGAAEHCRKFFDDLPEPEKTAVFCANAFQADCIYKAVGTRGRYYSISTSETGYAPTIFNIIQPISAMAKRCFELLRSQQSEGKHWKAKDSRLKGVPDWK